MATLHPAGATVPSGRSPGAAQTDADADADRARGLVYDGLVYDGGCGPGLYAVIEVPGLCTPGPEAALDDGTTDEPAAAQGGPSAPSAVATVPCDGDGVSGHRLQIMYVRASDVPDRYDEVKADFQQRAAESDKILSDSAANTGGSRHLRFVHDASCAPDVAKFVLSPAGDDLYGSTVAELKSAGYNRTDRIYLLMVDSRVYCGIANTSVDDQPGQANKNNTGPNYARIDSRCWASTPTIAHEVIHLLGGVQGTSPNGTRGFHCVDEWDLMCYSDEPDFPEVEIVCPDPAFDVMHLDCNNDDYFHTDPPAGSYLDTHWNTADSRFLIVGAPTVVVPGSAAPGSFFSASVGPNPVVTPGKSYRLMWGDPSLGITCDHPNARKIGGPTLSAADGSIARTAGKVPRQARGTASVCFAKTSNPSADNSEPFTFIVL